MIGDAAYRRAVVTMNKNYGRRNEPFPLETRERGALLATAAHLATTDGTTLQQIADQAGLPLDDLQLVIGEPDPRPLVSV